MNSPWRVRSSSLKYSFDFGDPCRELVGRVSISDQWTRWG